MSATARHGNICAVWKESAQTLTHPCAPSGCICMGCSSELDQIVHAMLASEGDSGCTIDGREFKIVHRFDRNGYGSRTILMWPIVPKRMLSTLGPTGRSSRPPVTMCIIVLNWVKPRPQGFRCFLCVAIRNAEAQGIRHFLRSVKASGINCKCHEVIGWGTSRRQVEVPMPGSRLCERIITVHFFVISAHCVRVGSAKTRVRGPCDCSNCSSRSALMYIGSPQPLRVDQDPWLSAYVFAEVCALAVFCPVALHEAGHAGMVHGRCLSRENAHHGEDGQHDNNPCASHCLTLPPMQSFSLWPIPSCPLRQYQLRAKCRMYLFPRSSHVLVGKPRGGEAPFGVPTGPTEWGLSPPREQTT